MFVYIALLSAFGFALQNTLMAKYARLGDSLSMSFYRSVCLMVSLLPLLFLVKRDTVVLTADVLLPLLLAWISSALSYWLFMHSFKYLPIWITAALRYWVSVFVVSSIAWFYFQEVLSYIAIFCMILLLCGWAILSIFKTTFLHLDNKKAPLGLWLVFISWILAWIWYVVLANSARQWDPYLTWYLREVAVLIFFVVAVVLRKWFLNVRREKIHSGWLRKIFFASSPTLLGTWCFTLAATLWPVGIVSAITVSWILIATLLSVILYHEHLRLIQYIWIILIMLALVWLKLFV